MSQQTLLTIDNAVATARLSLFGGQVLSFVPKRDGRERLFLSSKALLDGSKSIRGGVPVCWPWFGAWRGQGNAHGMPAHGYARTRCWQLVSLIDNLEGTEVVLQLPDTGGPGFGGNAQLKLVITIGEQLDIQLLTTNSGTGAFPLSAALHSYFAIDDIGTTTLHGLAGNYSDKTQNWAVLPTPSPYRFAAETDRIHLQPAAVAEIACAGFATTVTSAGHDSMVVWNPWENGSKAFVDLTADDYRRFVCVETALTQGFVLEPGQQHCLRQIIG